MRHHVASLLFFALTACGQPTSATDAGAQSLESAQTGGELSNSDRTAILRTQNLHPDATGQVENECGERVTPQFLDADIGGEVGVATLFVMTGGPNSASCYGDGPGLTLLARDGADWRVIYFSRGGFMAVLPSQTRGVRDLAFAGPGFEHPLWVWNGTEYAPANRSIPDAQLANATILP